MNLCLTFKLVLIFIVTGSWCIPSPFKIYSMMQVSPGMCLLQTCQLVRFCRILYVFLKGNTGKNTFFKFFFFFFFLLFFFLFFFSPTSKYGFYYKIQFFWGKIQFLGSQNTVFDSQRLAGLLLMNCLLNLKIVWTLF